MLSGAGFSKEEWKEVTGEIPFYDVPNFSQEEWEEITEKALLYTLRNFDWLPDEESKAEALVYKAMEKALAGTRKWPKEKRKFLQFIFGNIDSEASHLVRKNYGGSSRRAKLFS